MTTDPTLTLALLAAIGMYLRERFTRRDAEATVAQLLEERECYAREAGE